MPEGVDNRGEGRRLVTAAGIVEMVAGESRAPILEHADQRTVCQERCHVVLDQVR
jgi:hypothetical protein